MRKFLKAMAHAILGEYAPYYILECAASTEANETVANQSYRVAPITEEAIRHCADPAIRDQAGYGGTDSLAYACYDGNRIVGVCFYWHSARYLTRNFWPLKPGEAKLVQIITVPDMRGKKVACTLIYRSGEHTMRNGFVCLYARIWHSNDPSLRAFAGAGWKRRALVLEFNPLRRKKPFRISLPLGTRVGAAHIP